MARCRQCASTGNYVIEGILGCCPCLKGIDCAHEQGDRDQRSSVRRPMQESDAERESETESDEQSETAEESDSDEEVGDGEDDEPML
jgi:hypothetical protein